MALVIFVIVAAPVAAAPAVKSLASPSLLSPANNANFDDYTQLVRLQWEPVASESLSGYLVEVEGYDQKLEVWSGFSSQPRTTMDTWYSVHCYPAYYGSYLYRWRVTALSGIPGGDSKPSYWRTFAFKGATKGDVRFPTLHVLSPANNAKFIEGTPQSYEWSLVPGAGSYVLFHQKLNAENEWKTAYPVVIFGSNPGSIPGFPYTPPDYWITAGTYRWRVVAQMGMEGSILETSNWRTFTVK